MAKLLLAINGFLPANAITGRLLLAGLAGLTSNVEVLKTGDTPWKFYRRQIEERLGKR